MTTDARDLLEAKMHWQDRRMDTTAARSTLLQLIRDAAAEGMPQAEIARALGWPRQRVNTLLQKG